MAIALGSAIIAILLAPPLNILGLRWRWAWPLAITCAAIIGISAAQSAGIL